jgi:hypothetical protein
VAAATHSGSPKQRPSAPEAVVERERTREPSSVDVALLTAQVRLLVQEELSKFEPESACEPAINEQLKAPEVDETLEVERDASLRVALGIVDSAILEGEWTADERQDVQAVWSSLDQGRKSQVLSKLFGAFNDGTIRATEPGPPI